MRSASENTKTKTKIGKELKMVRGWSRKSPETGESESVNKITNCADKSHQFGTRESRC